MSGQWVFVCGPSGAGKDSVLDWAATHLAAHQNIVFARRMVTRTVKPGSDHDPVTTEVFTRLMETRQLAWNWQAHGFHYGIDAHYAAQVAGGKTVVVNGSREHVAGLTTTERVRVVHVLADASQLASRLQQRGRDAPHEISRRLARNTRFAGLDADCTILNHGALADAGHELVGFLMATAAEATVG